MLLQAYPENSCGIFSFVCTCKSPCLPTQLFIAETVATHLKKTTDIEFNDIEKLKKFGFSGFKSVTELIADPNILPNQMGVYLVLNPTNKKPEFLTKGVGGFFKGKDPNISISDLNKNWVENSKVVYIGKAGGINGNATLRSRLKQYLRFGQGFNVGHYGGRLIWQLKNHSDLIFCWLPLIDIEPRELEKKLIADFIKEFGKRPFANLTG